MTIYPWEESVIQTAREMPRSGLLFDFMNFLSHPGLVGFIFWTVLALLFFRTRLREMLWPLIAAAIAVGLADLTSRRLLKAFVLRPRPEFVQQICNDPRCWGFVSSHATNIAALATVLCMVDRRNLFWGIPLVALVSISRIYLIDHYPLDVIGGCVLGFCIGSLTYRIFQFFKGDKNASMA